MENEDLNLDVFVINTKKYQLKYNILSVNCVSLEARARNSFEE